MDYLRDGRSPIPDSDSTSKVMSANKGKDTGPELELRRNLWKNGLRGYRIHPKNIPGRPDIAYTRYKLAIFMHGCFWHRCPKCNLHLPKSHTQFWEDKFQKNVERDIKKKIELESLGWKVLVIWECELIKDIGNCIEKIKIALVKRKTNEQ